VIKLTDERIQYVAYNVTTCVYLLCCILMRNKVCIKPEKSDWVTICITTR